MILFNLLFLSLFSFASFEPPALTRPVTDNAGLLKPQEAQSLNQILKDVYNSGGPQFAILTIDSLEGTSLFDASIKTVEKWKLGTEEKDKGLLIFIAKKERKIRIEVGQGLEGVIPDIIAKRAIEQIMRPYFKKGEYSQGIYIATLSLLKRAEPNLRLDSKTPNLSESKRSSSKSIFNIIFLIAALIIFIFNPRLLFYAFLFGRGGGGFGGRSGGGFSGGGGGFSGGGASGGW